MKDRHEIGIGWTENGDDLATRMAKNKVSIQVNDGHLRLYWRWQGKRFWLSLGYPDTAMHRRMATLKAGVIEQDLLFERFDSTLQRYKASDSAPPETKITLKSIWQQYYDYVSPTASPKTIAGTYNPTKSYLRRCQSEGLENPIALRQELLRLTTEGQARRYLMELSAACKWAVERGLITKNPLDRLYLDLKEASPNPPVAFSVEERDKIIAAFERDQRSGANYQHYAPLVKFLFWTGCRPSEAAGLRWGAVQPDCSKIHFREAIVDVSGRLERRETDKTGVKRWFACSPKLQALLLEIRPKSPGKEDLVFQGPRGGKLSISNFSDRGWNAILTGLGLSEKDGIPMTPYNCRDTFITLHAVAGVSSTIIARWVGNSSKVIEERYLEKLKLEKLVPEDL